MSTNPWVIPMTGVAATGNVKQLYPTYMAAGVAKAGSTLGQQIRGPMEGVLHSLQVQTDGTNGGTIEFWDLNGADIGVDVSSSDVITNAQLTAAIASGNAKLIYSNSFPGTVGSGTANAAGIYRTFSRGLAARFSNGSAVGTCTLNLVIEGGARYTTSLGGY